MKPVKMSQASQSARSGKVQSSSVFIKSFLNEKQNFIKKSSTRTVPVHLSSNDSQPVPTKNVKSSSASQHGIAHKNAPLFEFSCSTSTSCAGSISQRDSGKLELRNSEIISTPCRRSNIELAYRSASSAALKSSAASRRPVRQSLLPRDEHNASARTRSSEEDFRFEAPSNPSYYSEYEPEPILLRRKPALKKKEQRQVSSASTENGNTDLKLRDRVPYLPSSYENELSCSSGSVHGQDLTTSAIEIPDQESSRDVSSDDFQSSSSDWEIKNFAISSDQHNSNHFSSNANTEECDSASAAPRTESLARKNDFLDSLLKVQKTILKDRVLSVSPHAFKKTSRAKHNASILERACQARTVEDRWFLYTDTLDGKFFTSSEARMRRSEKVKKGTIAYKGLLVTAENCHDVQKMWTLGYEPKFLLGHTTGTFDQFKVALGQFARFNVSAGLCKVEEVCRKGALFSMICKFDAVQAFIGYFKIRCSNSTVVSKAMHLNRLGKYADSHFASAGMERERGAIGTVCNFLQGVIRAHKSAARLTALERKEDEVRDESGNYIPESDFKEFIKRARTICKELKANIDKTMESGGGRQVIEEHLRKTPKFLNKWCINFLCLMMLNGAGQRPQVYSRLEIPEVVDLSQMEHEARRTWYFEMKVCNEKRPRSVDLPFVIFPRSILPFLSIHVRVFHPFILKKCGIADEDPRRRFIFLNTKSGDVLSSHSVTASLRTFLKRIDPELGRVTTMTLRASYATMMLSKFRRGLVYEHLTEEKFISYLAKVMNTSEEQLKSTYAASRRSDLAECATMMTNMLNLEYSYDCSESDGGAQN